MTSTKKTRVTPQTTAPQTSKKDALLQLLRRDGGAALSEITEATGWLPHTARAMLTGLRKKGFQIGKEKIDGTYRYSFTEEPAA